MRKILAIVIGSAALLTPITASAQDACGASYMILPDGQCMNMEYLPILGASRGLKAQMDAKYLRQLDANVTLDLSRTYRLTETEKERDSRYQNLADTSEIRDKATSSNQTVEDRLYPLHQRAMGRVREAYSRRR